MEFEGLLNKNSRVLVVNPLISYWTFQLTCEAALRSRNFSENVKWLNVSPNFPKQYFINSYDYISRRDFQNPLRKIESALTSQNVLFDCSPLEKFSSFEIPDFRDIQTFRSYVHDDIPFGAIVYSAVASVKRSTAIQIDSDWKMIEYFFQAAMSMAQKVRRECLVYKPDLLITTNDRLPGAAVAIAVARNFKVPVKVVYWGSDSSKIQDYDQSLFDSNQWQQKISTNWSENPPNSIEYELLQNEIQIYAQEPSLDSKTFIGNQKKGLGLPKKNCTVIFFAQSEHEHSSTFLEPNNGRFKNQYDAFNALERVCEKLNLDLVLKLHPNRFDSALDQNSILEMNDWIASKLRTQTEVIPKNSDYDTYQLLNDAYVNVVWNSAVGLESIARGKKTLVLSNAHWLNLNWGIHAWSFSEIVMKLSKGVNTLDPKELAPWFWYIRNFGDKNQFTSIHRGLYILEHEIICERFFSRIFLRVKHLLFPKE